jgi:16S rRNA C1402 (ribose-2'-O) methylase RsmI
MSKIDLEEVQGVLEERKVPNASEIMKDLQQILAELEAEKEANKEPKPKFEYVVVVHDPSGELAAQKKDEALTAFVVQQEEGQDAGAILSKIADAAKLQNETASKKSNRLQNIRDIFDGLKSKFLKEKKVKIKTKEPVRIILTTGNIGGLEPVPTNER